MILRRMAVAALALAAFGGQAALAQDGAEHHKHHKAHHCDHKKNHCHKGHHKNGKTMQHKKDESKAEATNEMKSDMPTKSDEAPAQTQAAPAEANPTSN